MAILVFLLVILAHRLKASVVTEDIVIIGRVGQLFDIDNENIYGLKQIPSGAPRWMVLQHGEHFAISGQKLLRGLPLASDVGNYTFSVASTIFKLQVLGTDIISPNGMRCKESRATFGLIEMDIDLAMLTPVDRICLVQSGSSYLLLTTEAVGRPQLLEQLTSNNAARLQSLYVLASGPGNTAFNRTVGTRFQWFLGCGTIESLALQSLQMLEKSAVTGALSAALFAKCLQSTAHGRTVPVLSWVVGDVPSLVIPMKQMLQPHRLKRSAILQADSLNKIDTDNQLDSKVAIDEGSGLSSASIFSSVVIPTMATESGNSLRNSKFAPTDVPLKIQARYTGPKTGRTLSHMRCTVGMKSLYKVPEDAFFDAEDGNARKLSLQLTCSSGSSDIALFNDTSETESGSLSDRDMRWLMWKKHSQSVECFSPGLNSIGDHQCTLSARDKDGNEVNEAFYIKVGPPHAPSKKAAFHLIANLVKGFPFSKVLNDTEFFSDVYRTNGNPLQMVLRLSKDEDVPASLNLFFDTSSNTFSAFPLSGTQPGEYFLSLEATNHYQQRAETSVRLNISELVLSAPPTHVFRLLLRSRERLGDQVLRLFDLVKKLNFMTNPHTVRLLSVQQITTRSRRNTNQQDSSLPFYSEVQFDIPELNTEASSCPVESIKKLRNLFFVLVDTDSQCQRRVTPLFSKTLVNLQAVNMSVESLGSCRSAQSIIDYQCASATSSTVESSTQSSTSFVSLSLKIASQLPLRSTPALFNQAPVVNLETDVVTGRKYCIRPFKVFAGYSFTRWIRRTECVVDPEDGDMKNLLILLQPPSDNPSILLQRDSWILFDKKTLTIQGMPLSRDVGNHTFRLRIFDNGIKNSNIPAKFVTVPFDVEVIPDPDPYRYHKVTMTLKSDMWTRGAGPNILLARQLTSLLGFALSDNEQIRLENGKIYIGNISKSGSAETEVTWAWSRINELPHVDGCPFSLMKTLYNTVSRGRLATILISKGIVQTSVIKRKGLCQNYEWTDIFEYADKPKIVTKSSTTDIISTEQYRYTKEMETSVRKDLVTKARVDRILKPLRARLDANKANIVISPSSPSTEAMLYDNIVHEGKEIAPAVNQQEKQRHFLLTTILPACVLIVVALSVAVIVACCLQRHRTHHTAAPPHYQDQILNITICDSTAALQRKKGGRNTFFCQDFAERPAMVGKPLILPNEKPPLPPPDYALEELQDPLLYGDNGTNSLHNGHSTFTNFHQGVQHRQLMDNGLSSHPL